MTVMIMKTLSTPVGKKIHCNDDQTIMGLASVDSEHNNDDQTIIVLALVEIKNTMTIKDVYNCKDQVRQILNSFVIFQFCVVVVYKGLALEKTFIHCFVGVSDQLSLNKGAKYTAFF